MGTHKEYLRKQLRDKQFAETFNCEKQKLRIAYEINTARVKSGLSQQDLARMAGVTQQMVSRIETASKANMSHGTVCKIAEALGMDVGLVPRAR